MDSAPTAAGTRFSNRSSRHAAQVTTFTGPVRRWRKQRTKLGRKLSAMRWVPIAAHPTEDPNSSSSRSRAAQRPLQYLPVSVVMAQLKAYEEQQKVRGRLAAESEKKAEEAQQEEEAEQAAEVQQAEEAQQQQVAEAQRVRESEQQAEEVEEVREDENQQLEAEERGMGEEAMVQNGRNEGGTGGEGDSLKEEDTIMGDGHATFEKGDDEEAMEEEKEQRIEAQGHDRNEDALGEGEGMSGDDDGKQASVEEVPSDNIPKHEQDK